MKKFQTKEIVALIIIGVLMITTVVVGGYFIVNNVNEANKKAESTGMVDVEDGTEDGTLETTESETQAEGEEVTVSDKKNNKNSKNETKETSADKDKTANNEATEKKTQSDKKNPTKNNSNKNDKNNKNNGTSENNNNNNGTAVEVIIPETNATHSSKKVLKVNGVDCFVGDTITVTMNMKTPEVLMNFQGYTKYDDKYLKLESVKGNVNGMFNDFESCIYYNGSDINKGFDFTEKGTLYTATFKVLKEGNTGVVNTIEVLTGMSGMDNLDEGIINPKDAVINIGIFN